jgi:proline iminopeptidase
MAELRADDGCRLWTAETGHGEPLIMCHGGPGLWDMSGSLAAQLAERVTVIRWDQRGGGRSERRGPYSVARCVADLDAIVGRRTRTAPGKVALFGHSWGATLALRYAVDHPDRVSALVYACGTGLGWAWREPFGRAISARLAPHQARIEELRTWHEDELIEQCRALQVPVLIIDGERDLRPRSAVDSLARALPRVTRIVLPDAGHIPWLEEPEAVAGHLLDFLEHQAA